MGELMGQNRLKFRLAQAVEEAARDGDAGIVLAQAAGVGVHRRRFDHLELRRRQPARNAEISNKR